MDNCIFCRIARGEIPSSRIYEDDFCFAMLDIQPVNPGHTLVVPKQHSALMEGLSEEILGRLMVVAGKINSTLRKSSLKCEAVNLHVSDGESAGQEVPHVHIHVIPRFAGDGFGMRRSEKSVTEKPTREQLEATAAALRSLLR